MNKRELNNVTHAIWMLSNAIQELSNHLTNPEIWTIENAMKAIEEATNALKR